MNENYEFLARIFRLQIRPDVGTWTTRPMGAEEDPLELIGVAVEGIILDPLISFRIQAIIAAAVIGSLDGSSRPCAFTIEL